MPNILQQLLQDFVGTKRGQAIETAVQPTLTALSPISQDLLKVAAEHDPKVGQLVTLGETVANAINQAPAPAPAPTQTGPTEADVVTILNDALTALGLPSSDDATFDAALDTAYNGWQARQAGAVTANP